MWRVNLIRKNMTQNFILSPEVKIGISGLNENPE